MGSIKEALTALPKLPPVKFVLTSLDGMEVCVKRESARGIRGWWVYDHNEGSGRKYDDKLRELWKRFACEEDGTPISSTDEDVDKLVEKFGGAFLAEFESEARRVNWLFSTTSQESAERGRFFTERSFRDTLLKTPSTQSQQETSSSEPSANSQDKPGTAT